MMLALVLLGSMALGAEPPPPPDPLRAAREAYAQKDYAGFLKRMREAEALEPTRPRVLLGLASAQALGGAPNEVAVTLERLAAMGLAFEVEKEPEFAELAATPAFKAVVAHFAKNRAPQGSAKPVFSLQNTELVEGVTFDAPRKRYLVGSVRHRKIIAVDAKGKATDFVAEGQHGLGGVFGLAIDEKRNVLWVTTAFLPQVAGFKDEEKNRSGVFKLDVRTGALLGSWFLPQDATPHVLGDVVVGPTGDAFVTDSLTPAVYRVDAAKGGLEKWAEGRFRSLQGLGFLGGRLYVADYALGLFAIEVASRSVTQLKTTRDVASVGIDGLYVVGRTLVATQNGIEPQRVMQFELDATGLEVTKQKVLVSGDPVIDDLSLGAVVGKTLVFNAHSGWSAFADDGARKEGAPKGSSFVSVPLE